jgi:energy-coupling factor transporter ATP-binding protein EcfA2
MEGMMKDIKSITCSPFGGQATTEDDDLERAKKLLVNPRLLDEIIEYFNQSYLGREKEKKLLYLISLFTKLNQSSLVVITGETSSGKSSLVETVINAIPEEAKMFFTATSGKFFLYLNKPIHNKVLVVYEIEGIGGLNFLKTFITEGKAYLGSVIKTSEGLRPVEIKKDTRGLVCITTTTKTIIDEEVGNRGFILNIETPPEMIREIILKKQELKSPDFRVLKLIYQLLRPVDVVIPFFNKLAELFPCNEPRRLRDFDKIVNLIKAHALLHQYQREKTANNQVIATINDYKSIYHLADIIIPAFSGLTDKQRKFLDWLRPSKTTSQINAFCKSRGIPRSTYYFWLKKLTDCGLVDKEFDTYVVIGNPDSFSLPSPEEISLAGPLENSVQPLDNTAGKDTELEIIDATSKEKLQVEKFYTKPIFKW